MLPHFPATIGTRDGLALATRHWPLPDGVSPRGVALLVHGLGEHIGRYDHVAKLLNGWGWAAVGYDHRGHGRSPGPQGRLTDQTDLLHDLAAVVDATRTAYPGQRLLLIGHSLGGLVAARFVAAQASPAEGAPWARPVDLLVLSSPAFDPGLSWAQKTLLSTFGALLPDLPVPNGLKPDWICSDPAVVKAYLADPLVHDRATGRLTRFILEGGANVLQRAPHWTTPTLLLYGGADRCVRPAGSARFAAAAPHAVVCTQAYPRMAHEIFNEPDQAQVFADLARWLDTV
ncbi:MAG: alpha/beta hydrolase [Rubrivivax sp.]|nr:MAG: alpha/beta hydrolase [Rubrivivax sp.]